MANEISDFESKITSLRGLVANQRKINESLELKLQVRTGKVCMRWSNGKSSRPFIGLQYQNWALFLIGWKYFVRCVLYVYLGSESGKRQIQNSL